MKILTTIKHQNYVMLEARKSLGITQAGLAEMIGENIHLISEIELLNNINLLDTDRLEQLLNNIADVLGMEFSKIFPPDYMNALSGKRLSYRRQMIFDMEIQYLESKTPKLLEDGNPEINQKEMEVGLNEVLSILTFNEKKVLELRFGLNGNEIHTLRACAKEIGVTPERTRQIESNALYKLRRNNIPKKIRELIETANGQ